MSYLTPPIDLNRRLPFPRHRCHHCFTKNPDNHTITRSLAVGSNESKKSTNSTKTQWEMFIYNYMIIHLRLKHNNKR